MKTFPLDIFLALVKLDRSILHIDRSIEALRDGVRASEHEFALLEEFITKARDFAREQHKAVDQVELRMKELDGLQRQKEGQFEAASTQKEYGALKNEIETVKKDQHNLENGMLQAWKSYEHAQTQYQQKKEEVAHKQAALNAIIQEKMQHIDQLEKERAIIMASRPAALEGIPAEWLQTYAMMQSKVEDPVVPVENETCSACFYGILRQDMIDLGKRKMLQCRDCFRFLYLPEAYAQH
jgi:predicted  nucleic acid-binding Zn-ribbon protein